MRQALITLVLTGLMVFTIVDIITIDPGRVKHLPKPFWIVLAIITSIIGSLLWFLVGRERLEPRENGRYAGDPGGSRTPRAARQPTRRGPTAPDDDPEFLARIKREAEQQERIRQLEEKLRDLDDDKPKD